MATSSGYDHEFKFCLIGPSRVGKTCVRMRGLDDIFQTAYLATIGPEFVEIVRNYDLAKKVVKETIWDGPGSEKHATEAKKNAVMNNCDGALIIFDVTRRTSFEKVETHWSMLMNRSPNARVVLVGNKTDMPDMRQVSEEEGVQLSKRLCCDLYIEVSAKTGAGFPEVFNYLERACLGGTSLLTSSHEIAANPKPKLNIHQSLKNIGKLVLPLSGTEKESIDGYPGFTDDDNKFAGRSLIPTNPATSLSRSKLGNWYPPQDEREASLRQFRLALTEGLHVLIYPHGGGAPEYTMLYIDRNYRRLYWDSTGSHDALTADGVYISDIAEIRPPTENAYTFKQMKIPRHCEGKNCLFSIIASEKSVSMGAKTPDQCIFIVSGLKLITECTIPTDVKKMRGKEQWTHGRFMILRGGRVTMADISAVQQFKSNLKRGIEVMKFKANGRKDRRMLRMDEEETRLTLSLIRGESLCFGCSVATAFNGMVHKPEKGIDIEDIAEIRPGYEAFLFSIQDPILNPAEEGFAVSIIGSECTMSLVLNSKEERNQIVACFQGLLRMYRPTVSVY